MYPFILVVYLLSISVIQVMLKNDGKNILFPPFTICLHKYNKLVCETLMHSECRHIFYSAHFAPGCFPALLPGSSSLDICLGLNLRKVGLHSPVAL